MGGSTGYEPLDTPKEIAPGLWIIDGPAISFYGLPFSTRATVARLSDGRLWVHSPTRLTRALQAKIAALGEVAFLVAPNWIHYAYVSEWQVAFPEAESWAAPGVVERAAKKGLALHFDRALEGAEMPWGDEIDGFVVEGSKVHREAVFFHKASRTVILTDLIENFEPEKLPWWMRPVVRLAGIAAPQGHMPPDMKATFDTAVLRSELQRILAWAPDRVVLAHGEWIETGGSVFLEGAFGAVLKHG